LAREQYDQHQPAFVGTPEAVGRRPGFGCDGHDPSLRADAHGWREPADDGVGSTTLARWDDPEPPGMELPAPFPGPECQCRRLWWFCQADEWELRGRIRIEASAVEAGAVGAPPQRAGQVPAGATGAADAGGLRHARRPAPSHSRAAARGGGAAR